MQRIIGIDFGTSTTYMNIKRYNGSQPVEDRFSYIPVVFNYGGSSGMVASIVRVNADGSYDFGEKAEEQLQGAGIYKEIKMLLESTDEAQRAQARHITEEFFKFLYETYAQQAANLGSKDDAEETIVSYPVKWQPETVAFMLEAARKAGFQNVRGMDEATAAVLALLCQNANSEIISAGKPGYLMLVDMGAGTTDLVICKYQTDENGEVHVELVANWPRTAEEPAFGGREIDRILEKYVEDYLSGALIPAMAPNAHVIATMPGQAKMWKEKNVSVNLCANKPVNTCAYLGTYKTMGILTGEFPPFGRQEFERIAQSGLRDYVNLLLGCLNDAAAKDAAFAADGLDLVILTGGHSAWYFAQEIIDGTMEGFLEHPALSLIRNQKNRVVRLPNPQTTVSLGLVYSRLPFELSKAGAEATDRQQTAERSAAKTQPAHDPQSEGASQLNVTDRQQTEDGKYVWDDRLLGLLRQYMSAHGGEISVHLRNSESPELRRRLNVPWSAEVFLAHDDSVRKSGGCGFVVAGTGIYYKGLLSNPLPCISWERFMNGRIRFSSQSAYHTLRLETTSGAIDFVTMTLPVNTEKRVDTQMKIGAFFEQLQAFLRQKAAELQQTGELSAEEDVNAPVIRTQPLPDLGGKNGQTVVQNKPYDPSKCPKCGTAIPAGAKKCPVCGRAKLPEPITPFKMNLVAWYKGETQFGIAKATGSLTILEDRIEYKKNLGNAAEMIIPYWNIYKAIKTNTEPREVFWMHDIAGVKQSAYGLGVPAIVLTMNDGVTHTFVAATASQGNKDNVSCAVALITRLM